MTSFVGRKILTHLGGLIAAADESDARTAPAEPAPSAIPRARHFLDAAVTLAVFCPTTQREVTSFLLALRAGEQSIEVHGCYSFEMKRAAFARLTRSKSSEFRPLDLGKIDFTEAPARECDRPFRIAVSLGEEFPREIVVIDAHDTNSAAR